MPDSSNYYLSSDDANMTGLTLMPLLQGSSARATAGVAMRLDRGA
jgi:hypothetical protein